MALERDREKPAASTASRRGVATVSRMSLTFASPGEREARGISRSFNRQRPADSHWERRMGSTSRSRIT